MKMFLRLLKWSGERYRNAWPSKYPKSFHYVNIVLGAIIAALFAFLYFDDKGIGFKIGMFFAIWPISMLSILGATYGVVRNRSKR